LAAAGCGAGVGALACDGATATGAAPAGFFRATLDTDFLVLRPSVASFSATAFSRFFELVAGVFDPAFALAVVGLVFAAALGPRAPPLALTFFAGAALLGVLAALLFGFDFFAMGRS
jgi:hypothetical protein